jgi:hypothetical protein
VADWTQPDFLIDAVGIDSAVNASFIVSPPSLAGEGAE